MGLLARANIMAYVDSCRVEAVVIVVCNPIRKKLPSLSIEQMGRRSDVTMNASAGTRAILEMDRMR